MCQASSWWKTISSTEPIRPAPNSSPEAVSRRPDGGGACTVGRCPVRGAGNARAGWRGAAGERGTAVSRRGWALFLAMSLIWGVPYLLIKVAVGELPPVVVVFGRCALGAALLLPWTVARGQLRPALRHWRPLLAFTVLEMTGPWLLLAYAEQTLSSSLTGLLVAGVPFVAALAGRLTGEEERLTRVRLLGMGLGVAGIAVLLGLDVEGLAPLPLLAVALVLVGYATAPLVVSRALPDVPGVAASAVALTVTALVYAPFAVPRLGAAARGGGGWTPPPPAPPGGGGGGGARLKHRGGGWGGPPGPPPVRGRLRQE